jgi:hypothetical protein
MTQPALGQSLNRQAHNETAGSADLMHCLVNEPRRISKGGPNRERMSITSEEERFDSTLNQC